MHFFNTLKSSLYYFSSFQVFFFFHFLKLHIILSTSHTLLQNLHNLFFSSSPLNLLCKFLSRDNARISLLKDDWRSIWNAPQFYKIPPRLIASYYFLHFSLKLKKIPLTQLCGRIGANSGTNVSTSRRCIFMAKSSDCATVKVQKDFVVQPQCYCCSFTFFPMYFLWS